MAYGTINADLMTTSDGVSSSGLYGFKNRLINSAMMIDQRNAGASVTPVNAQYTLDRWQAGLSQTGKYTIQQSTTAPTGFRNSLLITSTSAYRLVAGDNFQLSQPIEGYNTADLAWGTASASSVTLSFWVRCSLTGTFGGAIYNGSADRFYPFSYTISSANTFEYKTITITGDTSGTWLTNNGTGIKVYFALGMGSTYGGGTDGVWSSTPKLAVTGQTNWASTAGATFYITGVQLEVGSSATPFERRLYNQELANCQRYFQTISNGVGGSGSTTQFTFSALFPVVMRTAPSSAVTAAIRISDITTSAFTQSSGSITNNLVTAEGGSFHLPNFSGMTANRPALLAQSSSGTIQLSAEL